MAPDVVSRTRMDEADASPAIWLVEGDEVRVVGKDR
jgi:hypothetical protein